MENMRNIIRIKDVPSNTIEEAIIILKENKKAKKREYSNKFKNINELYEKCGYPSKAHFFKNFRYYTGMTPMEYRKRHMETGEKR